MTHLVATIETTTTKMIMTMMITTLMASAMTLTTLKKVPKQGQMMTMTSVTSMTLSHTKNNLQLQSRH